MKRVCVGMAALLMVGSLEGAWGQVKAPSASVQRLIAQGRAALKGKRYVEALGAGQKVQRLDPKLYEGPLIVARASFALDRADASVNAYQQALRLAPPTAQKTLQIELQDANTLQRALKWVAAAKTEETRGEPLAAARAFAQAAQLLPNRPSLAVRAGDLFEKAEAYAEALRVLEPVAAKSPSPTYEARLTRLRAQLAEIARKATEAENERIAAEERRRTREEDKRAREEEAKREAAEEKRKADEARRIEAARQEEERRAREEKERQDREEVDRLRNELRDFRRAFDTTSSRITRADSDVDDAERDVRKTDNEADRARDRRNAARRKRDEIKDRYDKADGVAKEVLKGELRSAQAEAEDAQDEVDRANRRFDRAKDRRDEAKNIAGQLRQALDQLRANISSTESEIRRLGGRR